MKWDDGRKRAAHKILLCEWIGERKCEQNEDDDKEFAPQREKDSNCIRNHFRSIAASAAAAAADAECRCIVYGEQMKMIGVRLHIDRATVVRKPSPHNVQLKWRKKQRMHTIATSTQYEKCVSPFRFSFSFFLRSRVDAEPIYLRDDWRWISWTFDRPKRRVYFKSECTYISHAGRYNPSTANP